MGADPEVIVAGAGPSGSVAALVLARAGVRVRLIDRAQFPRQKLCGDTLNPGALAILDGLGLGPEIRSRALPISGMTITGPRGIEVSADYPDGLRGAAIGRGDLDLLLVAAATAAGASLEQGVMVRAPIVSNGRVIAVRVACGSRERAVAAPVIIAADGRASRLATALRLSRFASSPRRWAFGAYFAGVSGQGTRGEMHVRGDGYIGIAPLPCGVTNVCVVRETPRRQPADALLEAVRADAILRDRFTHARRVTAMTALGPLAVDSTAAGCPGLLLAGDAAGFVDPMTGDGLRFALRGGVLAAQAALRELGTGRPAWRHLGSARAREFAGKWRINRALRALVASPTGVSVAARLATRWPAPFEYLIGVAGDINLVAPRARRSVAQ